jgi:predicted phage baseplate assembly protein
VPIKPPALDDRRHDDLVAELLARIPAHTPEWTHPRPGDPGRTLIDLFAWLADTVLYRANLIPERQRLAYLRLVGGLLRPAQPARGMVALKVKADRSVVALQVPAGATIAKPEAFSTLDFCTAYPLLGKVVIKRRLTPAEEQQFNALLPDLQAVYTGTEGNPQGYVTTELFAPGQPLDEGIDVVQTAVDRSLWIALLAPSSRQLVEARATLGADLEGTARALNVGLALALDRPDPLEPLKAPTPLPARWALSTGSDASTPEVTDFVALETLEDGTRDLTQSGVLRLALPALASIGAPPNDPRENLQSGVGDAPPRLESEDDAERLVTWLRLTPGP